MKELERERKTTPHGSFFERYQQKSKTPESDSKKRASSCAWLDHLAMVALSASKGLLPALSLFLIADIPTLATEP